MLRVGLWLVATRFEFQRASDNQSETLYGSRHFFGSNLGQIFNETLLWLILRFVLTFYLAHWPPFSFPDFLANIFLRLGEGVYLSVFLAWFRKHIKRGIFVLTRHRRLIIVWINATSEEPAKYREVVFSCLFTSSETVTKHKWRINLLITKL